MKLIKPSKRYKNSFLAALKEIELEGADKQKGVKVDLDINDNNFDDYLRKWRNEAKGVNLKRGRVPASIFWLVDNEEFIGRLSIRHRLNANLRKMGGHIGYWIRPSKRRQGYGTKILELGLKKAKQLGIKNILVTCDKDNKGSIKIIEKNHGKFKNEIVYNKNKKPKKRYWIKNT